MRKWLLAGALVGLFFVFRDPVSTAHVLSAGWHRAWLFVDSLGTR
jgi:hypothetical protein